MFIESTPGRIPPAEPERKKFRATPRGKAVAWGTGILLAAGATVGYAKSNESTGSRYTNALTNIPRVVESEIGAGKIDINAVTAYKVPKSETAYAIASHLEGHNVDSSDPVVEEIARQAGDAPGHYGVTKDTQVILQRDVFAQPQPSLTEQVKNHQL